MKMETLRAAHTLLRDIEHWEFTLKHWHEQVDGAKERIADGTMSRGDWLELSPEALDKIMAVVEQDIQPKLAALRAAFEQL